jgi:hypothetical protein
MELYPPPLHATMACTGTTLLLPYDSFKKDCFRSTLYSRAQFQVPIKKLGSKVKLLASARAGSVTALSEWTSVGRDELNNVSVLL